MMAELLLAWVLGFKHGLDADHLALIDNLGRALRGPSPRSAKYCGLLFSLGHSLAVLAMTLAAVLLGQRYGAILPHWLEGAGSVLAATTLILLALVNLRSLMGRDVASRGDPAHQRLLTRWGPVPRGRRAALAVMALGGLFAFSFDTMTQAALFASLGHHSSQPLLAATALSALFGLGMICSDTLNGLVVNRLLDHLSARQACEASARQARRRAMNFMTLSLALLSLLVAALALARLAGGAAVQRLEGHELVLGLGVIAWVLCSYAIAAWLSWNGQRSPVLRRTA